MASIAPGTQREDERPELVLTAPWGGLVADAPPLLITEQGKYFSVVNNLISYGGFLRQNNALLAFTSIPAPNEGINGIGAFEDATGTRHQFAITKTRLLEYNYGGSVWAAKTGALTGGNTDVFSWTIVGGKLCFCQGVDKVKLWDGGANFVDADAAAVPAKYLCEFGTHLLACNTIEAGPTNAPQRVRWTGAGDPTDWSSANAGQNDLFNDLGPITGVVKIGQSAYILQERGITQVTLTGNGLKPFQFTPLYANEKGCIAPWSVSHIGNAIIYVSSDNIYLFDGSVATPLCDKSISGFRVQLASAVLTDIMTGPATLNIFGKAVQKFVGTQLVTPFNAYLLRTPSKSWIFNIDEMAWYSFGTTSPQGMFGEVYLNNTTRFPSVVMCGDYLTSPGKINVIDLVARAIAVGTWEFKIGPVFLNDLRHYKTLKRVRIKLRNNSYTFPQITIQITNDRLDVQTKTVTSASNPHDTTKELFFDFSLPGWYFTVDVFGALDDTNCAISEIGFLFDVGGEVTKTT